MRRARAAVSSGLATVLAIAHAAFADGNERPSSAFERLLDGRLPVVTPWLLPRERKPLAALDITVKDQDGRERRLADLFDEPVLVTFFYTRCQNNRKCSMAVSQLASLQRELEQTPLHDKVRLLAVTYEPQFDTPERINRYATARGLRFGAHTLAVQPVDVRRQHLVEELGLPVSYNAGWVSTHGVEASLVDAQGRLVRKYTTLLWQNEQVVEDLRRVLAEAEPRDPTPAAARP